MHKTGLIYRGAHSVGEVWHAKHSCKYFISSENEARSVPSLHFSSRLGLAMEFASCCPGGVLVGVEPGAFLEAVCSYWDVGLVECFAILPTKAFKLRHGTMAEKMKYHQDPHQVTASHLIARGFEIVIYFTQPCKFRVAGSAISIKHIKHNRRIGKNGRGLQGHSYQKLVSKPKKSKSQRRFERELAKLQREVELEQAELVLRSGYAGSNLERAKRRQARNEESLRREAARRAGIKDYDEYCSYCWW